MRFLVVALVVFFSCDTDDKKDKGIQCIQCELHLVRELCNDGFADNGVTYEEVECQNVSANGDFCKVGDNYRPCDEPCPDDVPACRSYNN